jgi:hypothetical protein
MVVIAVGGIAVFIFLILAASGMKRAFQPDPRQKTPAPTPQTAFDGNRAYAHLERIVDFGPRPSGSEGLARVRSYIQRELDALAVEYHEHPFRAQTPVGEREMVNIVAVIRGDQTGVIALGTHYESKLDGDKPLVGANDGGSTTAWMLEAARALGPRRMGRSVWLCFFDGTETFGEDDAGLRGSRRMVERLTASEEFDQIDLMIDLDMIGDCYLNIERDPAAPSPLLDVLWEQAILFGYQRYFMNRGRSLPGDHLPFREAGAPAIHLADASYGGSIVEDRKLRHTVEDTVDRVCPGSLQVVGDVVLGALPNLDAQLTMLELQAESAADQTVSNAG